MTSENHSTTEPTVAPEIAEATDPMVGMTDVRAAVEAVATALEALRGSPARPAVAEAIDQARTAIEVLHPGLPAEVLRRLVASIADCHRARRRSSPRLSIRCHNVSIVLHLDPHWALSGADSWLMAS